jgi:hypothetical protein
MSALGGPEVRNPASSSGEFWVRTVEEIDEFGRSNKPAMLYSSRCPVDPTKINQEAACPAKP